MDLKFLSRFFLVLAANHVFSMPVLCVLRMICRLVAMMAELS